jgi:pimeloyl-ACP methyl ester carboxylesterase
LLNHGWPGSFLEFVPLIKPLTLKATTSTGKPVSFHAIVPSLPGYGFSTQPPENWTADDTARVYHTLMTDVLGYRTFATHGTDLGAPVSYTLYDRFNASTRAAHFAFIPFYPLNADQLAVENIALSPLEQFELGRGREWEAIGNGYYIEHSTKV